MIIIIDSSFVVFKRGSKICSLRRRMQFYGLTRSLGETRAQQRDVYGDVYRNLHEMMGYVKLVGVAIHKLLLHEYNFMPY